MTSGSNCRISVSCNRLGISVETDHISSSLEAADLAEWKQRSSCTQPLKNKKSINEVSNFQESSDEEELDHYEAIYTADHTTWVQESIEKAAPDYYREHSSSDYTTRFQQVSIEEQSDDEIEDAYIDHAKLSSLHLALGCGKALSSRPEQTRRKNIKNGGSGLTPELPDHRNRRSTIINGTNVNIVNNNLYSTRINQGGHTFVQNGGSRECRQFQVANLSGGTVTQGDVPFAGGGAARY